MKRFLGIIGFYRHCIPYAAELQAPLHDLIKGLPRKAKIKWTAEAEQAFQRCKDSLADAVCTTFLLPNAPLALRTDASNVALGAALDQLQPEQIWRPLGLFSKKLDDTQKRYSTYDRELLAIYEAVKHFERILEGRHFTIYTDHKPLVYAPDQRADKASPR